MKSHGTLLILCLLALSGIFFASCDGDETPSVIMDEATQQIINSGRINFDADGGQVTLRLRANGNGWSVKTENANGKPTDWCSTTTRANENETAITVKTTPNRDIARRTATLTIATTSKRYKLDIEQKPSPQFQIVASHVDVLGTGGDVLVTLRTNTQPEIIMDKEAPWLTFVGIRRKAGNHKANDVIYLEYCFKAERNADLGRLARVTFTMAHGKSQTACVHQWSRKLKATENIHVGKPGQLGTLLGANANDWANIERLTLSGTLNATDIQALRMLLRPSVRFTEVNAAGNISVEHSVPLGLKHVDMGACKLVKGGDEYVEPRIDSSTDPRYNATRDNELGDKAFLIARTHLETITLPASLEHIGNQAFCFCEHLKGIDIPATVTDIGARAFSNCKSLTRINIPEDSRLQLLGQYALATTNTLAEIRLPATLIVNTSTPPILGGVHARNLHVKWLTPPSLGRYGIHKNTTVYVPMGAAVAYRQADGWKRAAKIIEE